MTTAGLSTSTSTADVCLSCGCGHPLDDHQDSRNITLSVLTGAADAVGIGLGEAAANIAEGVDQLPVASDEALVAEALSRPELLVDIDGVLGFLTETTVTALNAHFQLDLVVSEMRDYWLEAVLPEDQSEWLVAQYQRGVTYANVAPDYSAIAALGAASRAGYWIIVSSDRPPATAGAVTAAWLEKWRVPHDRIELRGKGGKLAIAESYGLERPLILIDDDPRKMETVARPGVEVWAPQRPWTPEPPLPPHCWVFERWADALSRLGVTSLVPVPQFSRDAGPALESAGTKTGG